MIVDVVGSTFSGNVAGDVGGGFFVSPYTSFVFVRGRVSLANSTFVSNSAGSGGAISSQNSLVSLTNCTVIGDSAASGPGGISVDTPSSDPGVPTLVNSIVLGNVRAPARATSARTTTRRATLSIRLPARTT